jgi:hypothetical protein
VEILFIVLVVLINANARRRCGRQKHVMVRHARGVGGGLHIGNIDLQFFLSLVFYRPGADDRNDRQDGATHHRFLEVLGIVFRE